MVRRRTSWSSPYRPLDLASFALPSFALPSFALPSFALPSSSPYRPSPYRATTNCEHSDGASVKGLPPSLMTKRIRLKNVSYNIKYRSGILLKCICIKVFRKCLLYTWQMAIRQDPTGFYIILSSRLYTRSQFINSQKMGFIEIFVITLKSIDFNLIIMSPNTLNEVHWTSGF